MAVAVYMYQERMRANCLVQERKGYLLTRGWTSPSHCQSLTVRKSHLTAEKCCISFAPGTPFAWESRCLYNGRSQGGRAVAIPASRSIIFNSSKNSFSFPASFPFFTAGSYDILSTWSCTEAFGAVINDCSCKPNPVQGCASWASSRIDHLSL